MAIQWGSFQNHVRVGIDITQTPATVGSGTTSVQLAIDVYVQTDSSAYMNNIPGSVAFTGWWTGGWGLTFNMGPGQTQLIHRVTLTEATATSVRDLWYGVTVAHMFGSTYGRRDHQIGARPPVPPSAPGTPTGLSIARTSDVQHTLSWSTPGAAATSVTIQRRENGGAWAQIAKPSGNPSSYVDKSTKANRLYEYRVSRTNAGGTSAWSGTASVYTTPAAPTGVTASRSGGGIRVAASGLPPYAASYDVLDGTTQVATGVALPWTHAAPNPATPHTYKVRAKRGNLVSVWSAASNTVNLTAPPAAPSALAPNGRIVDIDAPLRLSWKHQPVDASVQTMMQIEVVSRSGVGSIEMYPITTSSEFLDLTSARDLTETIGVTGAFEWRVRTKGEHPDWSPWSPKATFEAYTAPQVSITEPGAGYDSSQLTVAWSWFHDAGRPQSAWEVTLVQVDTGAETAATSGTGATSTVTLPPRLVDATEYRIAVRAATGGLWSAWAEQVFLVEFVPPAAPLLDGSWQEDRGVVSVSCWEGENDPAIPETVALDILRSVDAGATWEPVVETSETIIVAEDGEALSHGGTMYRAIAYAVTGASTVTEITVIAQSPAMWLSGGDGYAIAARLPYDPVVQVEAGRSRSVQRYEGRALGVAYAAADVTRTVDASGTILEHDGQNAEISHMETLAQAAAPIHLYRDPDGRRIYGSMSNVSLSRETGAADGAIWTFAFQLEETDH